MLVLGSVTCVTLDTAHAVASGIRATEYKQRLHKPRPQSVVLVVLTAFASLLGTPSRGRHTADGWLWRCTSAVALPIECAFLAP